MTITFKGLRLSVEGYHEPDEPEVGILGGFRAETIYYKGCDVTEIFENCDLIQEIEFLCGH